jgi:hypothetical protein
VKLVEDKIHCFHLPIADACFFGLTCSLGDKSVFQDVEPELLDGVHMFQTLFAGEYMHKSLSMIHIASFRSSVS